MGILTSWLDKQVNARLAQTMKAANMFGEQYRFVGGFAVYPDAQLTTLLEASFNTNIYYYSIIRTITRKFAAPPRYVVKSTTNKGRKALSNAVDNELSQLLAKPNTYQGADEFWEAIAGYYTIAGEAFIWKNRGVLEKGKPVELYVLPPQCIEIVPDPEDIFGVLYYNFNVNGTQIRIEKDDIIHWKTFNPNFDGATREHLRGFNPLQAQAKTITASNDSVDAQVAMMQNGGAKGVLYNETLNNLSPTQETGLRGVVDKKINNKTVKAAVATMQGKWGYLNLGASSIDMQLLEATESTIKALCNANGLPYELFQSDTTFANKEQALIYYVTNVLQPMTASLDNVMTNGLSKDFGGAGDIMTDLSELPEMATLNAKLITAAAAAWWKTPNEKRIMTMDEALLDANMDKIWMPSGMTPIDIAAEPIMPAIDTTLQEGKQWDYYK
jgi:HK97 family phage portal protein